MCRLSCILLNKTKPVNGSLALKPSGMDYLHTWPTFASGFYVEFDFEFSEAVAPHLREAFL